MANECTQNKGIVKVINTVFTAILVFWDFLRHLSDLPNNRQDYVSTSWGKAND